MRRRFLLAAAPLASVVRAQSRPTAVASFTILADMVKEIAGDALAVTAMVGPNGDAHEFNPKPSDLRMLRAAAILVRNGLGFEPWLDRLVRSSGFKGADIVASAQVQPRTMREDDHDHEHGGGRARREVVRPRVVRDPHAWQDPRNGVLYVRTIADGLAKADGANAATYRRRAEDYAARIQQMDTWIESQFAPIPREKRRILTSHDAFGYFGARYGIAVHAAQGVSTEGEPSAQDIATLDRLIRQEGIRALFVENMTTPAGTETLARAAGAVIGVLCVPVACWPRRRNEGVPDDEPAA
jgi:zinc/manganese transport system substrate-binding protein